MIKRLALVIWLPLLSSTLFAHTYKGEIIPTIHDWTGFYAGLNVGGVKHTMDITDNQATTFNATLQEATNPKLTGGLQVGYRRQLDPNKVSGVFGVEFSANLANAVFDETYGSPFALYQLNSRNTLRSYYQLELIGGIAADKTLLFLAGGMSYTNISGSTTSMNGVPFFNSFSVAKKIWGSTLGGGIEYALTEKVSARIKIDVITPNSYTTSDNVGDRFQISNTITQATVGLNYTFG